MATNTASRSKNILISGAARGIGRCIARTLLQRGHQVYILDIDAEELSHTTNSHLKEFSSTSRLASSICDLRSIEDIRDHVQKAVSFFDGQIDVLINNAGIAHPYWKDGKTMEDKDTIQQWQAYIETNLTAPFVLSQACIPYMKASSPEAAAHAAVHDSSAGPCIIHVSSFRAYQSDPNQEGYAATKAGQLGLMHAMAVSLAPMGIRVNLVAPGKITAKHECKEGDEKGKQWVDMVTDKDLEVLPSNRPGRPEDIAQAVEYLMEAGFVTGQDIVVDGGAIKVKLNS